MRAEHLLTASGVAFHSWAEERPEELLSIKAGFTQGGTSPPANFYINNSPGPWHWRYKEELVEVWKRRERLSKSKC